MALADSLEFFVATDVGRKRKHNEDNYLVDQDMGLYVVADGMGGHAAGEVASAMAVRIVHDVLSSSRELLDQGAKDGPRSEVGVRQVLGLLEYAVQTASAQIHAEAQRDARKRGMGTTLSLMLIMGSHGYVAHVGDSRIYLHRQGVVHQVTEDHTVANELLRLGMVTADQLDKVPRKNAITRAVGVYQHVEVDTLTLEVLPNDQFVLCSDGLAGYFDDTGEDLSGFLIPAADGERVVGKLVEFANERGGKDNITAVLVRLGGGDNSDSVRAHRLALKREVLAAMPLFARLNERELLRVMQVAGVSLFKAGEVVVREGDLGDEMFVTLQGKLRVAKGNTVLNELGVGDHLGEMALIRSTPRSATVTAIEPSELISLKRDDFFEILRTEPHVAVKLLWQFLNVLAHRLDQTSRELSTVREELSAEDITADAMLDSEDPFARPSAATMLGSMQLGLHARLRAIDDESPPPGDAAGDAPELAQRIDDAPSFDDAPELARRIDDAPSFDGEPAAKIPAGERKVELDSTLGDKLRQRIAELEAIEGDVPFDARRTRPGKDHVKTAPMEQAAEPDPASPTPPDRPRADTLRSLAGEAGPTIQIGPHDDRKAKDFRPTKVTIPLDPPAEVQGELDELRKEFKERLARAREEREHPKAKDSD